jgi:hypothetical protein
MSRSLSTVTDNIDISQIQQAKTPLNPSSFQKPFEQIIPPQELVESLIDGVLILTEQRELLYANDCAHRILRQLDRDESVTNKIPEEIWSICQMLIESRHLFPTQYWLIESKVFVDSSIAFNIQVRWLKLKNIECSCLLLCLHDKYQYIKEIVSEESQKCGLTSREKEVWLLHLANYTYKQVALELGITPNTVKKHMKNIHSKKKAMFIPQET